MAYHLTKSDYKLARTCATKLYYRKRGYPQANEQDRYLEMLADTGFVIEELVRLRYPEGQFVPEGASQTEAYERTCELLKHEQITLFEATVISGQKLARIDILIRNGFQVDLIEIKSKSIDGTPDFWTGKGTIRSGWLPYLEDITFQTHVLQEHFPELQIRPQLALIDKSQPITLEHMWSHFEIEAIGSSNAYQQRRVIIKGEHDSLLAQPIISIINVEREVQALIAEVAQAATIYSASLEPLVRLEAPLTARCQQCEFRHEDPAQSGFHECWRDLAQPQPHLLDLYRIAEAGGRNLAQQLINLGKVHLFDIPVEQLQRKDGSWGAYGVRQRVQIEYTKNEQEWLDPAIQQLIEQCDYPLHFIDFETARFALPTHAQLRPYATEAFVWSCHTVQEDGSIEHRAWINEGSNYPNAEFARSLLEQLGESGSVLIWSPHERTTLNEIQHQLFERGEAKDLQKRIDQLLTSDRIIDMHAITKAHYFHPLMGRSTSLKPVADAIWRSEPDLRQQFSQFGMEATIEQGFYSALPPMTVGDQTISIREGTQAIRAYQTLLYLTNETEREIWRDLLLDYCHHDTLAMVLIWVHWHQLLMN